MYREVDSQVRMHMHAQAIKDGPNIDVVLETSCRVYIALDLDISYYNVEKRLDYCKRVHRGDHL